MRMGTLAAIAVSTGCLTLGGLAIAQGTGVFDNGTAGSWAPKQGAHQAIKAPALDKKVTKRFTNVPLSEVLAWLSLQDLSFVAENSAFGDRKVTFSFVNQPLGEVIETIAEAYGGTWVKNGDIYTLKPQSRMLTQRDSNTVFDLATRFDTTNRAVTLSPDVKRFQSAKALADTATKNWVAKSTQDRNKDLTPEQKAQVEKAMAEAKKAIKEAIEQLKDHKGELKGLNDKQMDDLMRQLHEILGKTLPMAFERMGDSMFEFQKTAPKDMKFEFKGMDPKDMKFDFKTFDGVKLDEKALQELMKGHGDMKVLDPKAMQELMKLHGDVKVLDKKHVEELMKLQGDMKVLDPKAMQDLMKLHGDLKVLDKKRVEELMKLKGDLKGLDKQTLEKMHKSLDTEVRILDEKAMQELMKSRMADAKAMELHAKGMAEKLKALDKDVLVKAKDLQMKDKEHVLALEKSLAAKGLLSSKGMDSLLSSLTDSQAALMKKQGYLAPKDLTEAQRKMLGTLPEGKWEFTYSKNGKKVTIKGG